MIPEMFRYALFLVSFLVLLLPVACGDRPSGIPGAFTNPTAANEPKKATSVETEIVSDKMDWGREIALDDLIQMAKDSEIREVQWHVMPNIIRAEAVDNHVFHIRNEDKGLDIRKVLEDSEVLIGEGGIVFRYLF